MIEHTLDTRQAVLYLRPTSALRKEDFEELAKTVDPFLESHGELAGIVVEAESFPGWESFGALAAHVRFVRDHHRRIRKIAVVTDSRMGDLAEKLGSHFIAATIRHFPAGHTEAAQGWIAS